MKSIGMTEPKQIATFIALGGIATASWFERESFVSWANLEDAYKKTWCIKLKPSDAIACGCQNFQQEDDYIREYIVKFSRAQTVLWGNEPAYTQLSVYEKHSTRST